MTLRTRIAAVAGLAVAVAVLLAAVAVYVAVRSNLRGQVDSSLHQRAGRLLAQLPGLPPGDRTLPTHPPPAGFGGIPLGRPGTVTPGRFGGASGYVQFLGPNGAVTVPGGQGSSPRIHPNAAERAIAARGHGELLADRTVRGTHLRVLTVGTRKRGALMVALPLTEVDRELSHILLVLALVGAGGIALAVLLGALVARTALAPIAYFTSRTEQLTGDPDLSHRLQVGGRDELGRLAASFNATLDALERSAIAQRQLIADAGHELRTPIASLRANIQVLQDANRLSPDEREALRRDIVEELDELTALVGDVIELARSADGRATAEEGEAAAEEAQLDEVRLDEIVAAALERTRRRGALRLQVQLQPTLVRGSGERINRAVTNLLDNARKWSPPDSVVEVTLRDGVLTVRDHGPGFAEADLQHVFERFYRAESARGLPGSGLGLAIVRQAAESHHGYAKAANAPGGGARLEVSFGPPLALPDLAELTDDRQAADLPYRFR